MKRLNLSIRHVAVVIATLAVAGIVSCAEGSSSDEFSYEARAAHIAELQKMSDAERATFLEERYRERLEAHPTNVVEGVVRDPEGSPISGVRVFIGDRSTETGQDGAYSLELPLGRRLLTFERPGYASIQRAVDIRYGGKSVLDSAMMPQGSLKRFDADTLAHITEGPISLDVEPGDLAFEDGTVVHGNVAVSVVVFDPRQKGHIDASPAVLEGVDADGNDVLLRSYGMLDVEFSQDGKKVNVRKGETVETSLDLGGRHEFEPGAGIPMWHHDTTKGLWVEDRPAMAKVEQAANGRFVATARLPHFSAWNFDDPSRAVCATIRIPTKNTTTYVNLRVISTDANGVPDGVNGNGIWSMTVPCEHNVSGAIATCAFNVPVADVGHSEVYFRLEAKTNNTLVNGTSAFTPIRVTYPGSPVEHSTLKMTEMKAILTARNIAGGSWCGTTKFSTVEVSGNINLALTSSTAVQNIPNRIPLGYPVATDPALRTSAIGSESSADPGFQTVTNNERNAATAANADADSRSDTATPRDLCLQNSNGSQADANGNGVGDVCEAWCNVAYSYDAFLDDYDLDGVHDGCDPDWSIWNPSQYPPQPQSSPSPSPSPSSPQCLLYQQCAVE